MLRLPCSCSCFIILFFQVINYEQVHPVNSWDEMKRRLGGDRRCFIFTHRLLPGEPLVILHVALGNSIASAMQVYILCVSLSLSLARSLPYFSVDNFVKELASIRSSFLLSFFGF